MDKFPGLIVVLTDGFAQRPTVLHPERWYWLITELGSTENIDGIGRHLLISSLLFATEKFVNIH
jgi:hypothetical protein